MLMPKRKYFLLPNFFTYYLDIVLVYFEEELFLNDANYFFYLGECCTQKPK